MTAAVGARAQEILRLKREIAYYCGVAGRTHSRARLQSAHALIRQREQQLQALEAQSKSGGGDDQPTWIKRIGSGAAAPR